MAYVLAINKMSSGYRRPRRKVHGSVQILYRTLDQWRGMHSEKTRPCGKRIFTLANSFEDALLGGCRRDGDASAIGICSLTVAG